MKLYFKSSVYAGSDFCRYCTAGVDAAVLLFAEKEKYKCDHADYRCDFTGDFIILSWNCIKEREALQEANGNQEGFYG